MKFSHSLQFNAVPEWSSKYINYSQLKKLIYALQKEQLYDTKSADHETQPLLTGSDAYVSRFLAALDAELRKIDKFYLSQETGLMANYAELQDDVRDFEQDILNNRVDNYSDLVPGRRRSTGSARFSSASSLDVPNDDSDGTESDHEMRVARRTHSHFEPDNGESEIYQSRSRTTNNTWGSSSNAHYISPIMEGKITLKKRIIALYTQLSELKSYIELNRTGFSKICKKFDKSLQTDIRQTYLDSLEKKSTVFKLQTLETLQNCISASVVTYARLSQDSFPYPLSSSDDSNSMLDIDMAESQLSSHLREHVVWERNTVWKDMMNLERKAQNVKAENRMAKLAHNMNVKEGAGGPAIDVNEGGLAVPETLADVKKMSLSQWGQLLLNQTSIFKFILITVLFVLLLFVSPLQNVLQKNCLAILVYASLLWATETIPLFVTSLLIPMLIVILPVLRDPTTGKPMDAVPASQYILSTMWSSVIMLLLGGFTLAAALSKYNIAKVLSTYILSSAGTNPKIILITNMGVALFVSMWVSNVAAPVLCYSIIQPLLRTLPRNSTYARSMILGIALASDVGGMASPIASPQNIFSIGLMDPPPSWGEWFIVSLPVCTLCVLGIWILLLISFPLEPSLKLLQLHPLRDPFTLKQWFVTFVSLGTIILWCFSNSLKGIFGEMGIISIMPLVIFFGTGLLTSDDFNNFMWTIVVLAMGGTTLGKAVTSSGLLTTVASIIKEYVEDKPIFIIVLLFGIVILTTATFVSHTVAAMIIVPLMSEIGANLPSGDHSRLLIMVASLLCSCAMGLPTSGFPNVTAISMINDVGDRYLSVGTFITRGVPASLICYVIIVTVGYGLMVLVGL